MHHLLRDPSTKRATRSWTGLAALLLVIAGCRGDDAASGSDGESETAAATESTSTSTTGESTGTTGSTTGEDTTTSTTGASTSDASTSAGTTGAETTGDATTTSTTGDTTGAVSFTVSGAITRSPDVKFTKGADGIGDVNIALVSECTMNPPPTELYAFVEAGDLSSADNAVAYEIAEVPAGTHYLIAFLDDDDSGDLNSGDLVASDGLGIKCTEVIVADADVAGADLELNLVLP